MPSPGSPRVCRICGGGPVRSNRRLLCATHLKQYCRTCDEPLPAGRVNTQCRACEGADKALLYSRPGRICALCRRQPVTLHSSWCAPCRRETYRIERRALQAVSRPCERCARSMPRGRRLNRCAPCERERRREWRKRQGERHCKMCQVLLPVKRETYCKDCYGMLKKWRLAYHAGDWVARRLGTVKTPRRWQAEN